MRLLLPIVALLGVVVQAMRSRRDARNIRLLAARLDCTLEEAERVYRLSREVGFGAAHERVFGRREPGVAAGTGAGPRPTMLAAVPQTGDGAEGAGVDVADDANPFARV